MILTSILLCNDKKRKINLIILNSKKFTCIQSEGWSVYTDTHIDNLYVQEGQCLI